MWAMPDIILLCSALFAFCFLGMGSVDVLFVVSLLVNFCGAGC
jgi:hypothetical protein